jgi:hypothetical protein
MASKTSATPFRSFAATNMSILGLNGIAYINLGLFLMCVLLVAESHLHQLRAMGPASVFTWKIRIMADITYIITVTPPQLQKLRDVM